jgi:hypothetical protein
MYRQVFCRWIDSIHAELCLYAPSGQFLGYAQVLMM